MQEVLGTRDPLILECAACPEAVLTAKAKGIRRVTFEDLFPNMINLINKKLIFNWTILVFIC